MKLLDLFRRKPVIQLKPRPEYWERRLRALSPERREKALANLVVMK